MAHSSRPDPNPVGPIRPPRLRLSLSSIRSSCRAAPGPTLGALMSQPVHHPPLSVSSFPFPLSKRLFRRFLSLNLNDDPPGLEPAYDSGSSAKLIRFGVDRPELGVLPPKTLTPKKSGTLSVVGDGDGVTAGDCFIAECLGGEGGRVDEECWPLVKRRETDAVAVEVPSSATGAGVRGWKAGGRRRFVQCR